MKTESLEILLKTRIDMLEVRIIHLEESLGLQANPGVRGPIVRIEDQINIDLKTIEDHITVLMQMILDQKMI